MANGCVKVLVLLVVALTLADCDAVSFRRQKRQSLGDLLPLWISRRWTSLSGKPPIQVQYFPQCVCDFLANS